MIFFLIGFMGSGKTYWGKIWAANQHFNFVDLDEVIEHAEGKTVADIFAHKGEPYFREIEALALRNFGAVKNTIIACGGGTPCYFDNMQWMNQHGTTIYLSTSAPEILARVMTEQDKRPLLKKMNQSELLFFIEQKLRERAVFYNAAKLILTAEETTLHAFGDFVANITKT